MRHTVRSLGSISIALVLLSGVAAQGQDKPPKDFVELRKDRGTVVQPVVKPSAGHPCAAFGPGFARIAGSDTCVKIGGAIGIGGGFSR